MENYIVINGQRTELTKERAEQLAAELQKKDVRLGDNTPGQIVNLGSHEMIVLGHDGGGTALLRKDILEKMKFGKDNNYNGSGVDRVCNAFAAEIADIVGAENVLEYEVDLTADDGLKDYGKIMRKASLLTAQQYRCYVEILDKYKPDAWWWLATPFSTPAHDNAAWIKCVAPSGYVSIVRCSSNVFGVRPFCILKSDIFVSI